MHLPGNESQGKNHGDQGGGGVGYGNPGKVQSLISCLHLGVTIEHWITGQINISGQPPVVLQFAGAVEGKRKMAAAVGCRRIAHVQLISINVIFRRNELCYLQQAEAVARFRAVPLF